MALAVLRAAVHLIAPACAAALIAGCATLPPGSEFPREASRALETPQETKFGKLTQGWTAAHGGLSGFRLLPGGIDSFSLRAEMADAAERTLDVQYFILHGDETGRLFIGRLLAAADRGVRVRILLDDANSVGGDRRIVALSAHPKIELRLFNPFRLSAPILRQTNLALEAERLSRRMHNKVLITDNAIAVAGGRNIGDEYFAANRAFEFGDFDVFVAGAPAVTRLSRSFDTYWNDSLSIPAEALTHPTPESLDAYRKELDEHSSKMADSDYERHVRDGTPLNRIVAGTSPLVFAPSRVLYDSPDKAKPEADGEDKRTLRDELMAACRATGSELLIVTPYLVPGASQLAMLRELRARGVRVRILTNSLASTDVPVVHAGYRKVRLPLAQMGIELFEVKPKLGEPQVGRTTLSHEAGEAFSLHAKVFVFDRQRVFVGSANFDMRSLHLNTEVGLIIDSAELARQVAERFEAITIPANSYQVKVETRLGEPAIAWITEDDDKLVELDHEPGSNFAREFIVNAVSILPIDDQL
jgi:putative cardiolipin synthase